jgi:hypothetical protein
VRLWGDDQPPETGHVRKKKTTKVGPFEVTTDANGRCEVRPPPYRPRAHAYKQGVGCSRPISLSPSGGSDQSRLVLVPLTQFTHLRGRVVQPDDSPAAEVQVSINELQGEDDPLVFVTTDADGRFERDVPGGRRVSLRAVIPGSSTCDYMFEVRAGTTCNALLRLPGDWALNGRLLQADGTPVPEGTKVQFWPDPLAEELGFDQWLHDHDALTDNSGRFEIKMEQPMSGLLTASGASVAGLVEIPHVVIDAAHPKPDITLRACASGSIAGRVIDESGRPLGSVRIRASAEVTPRDGASSHGPGVGERFPGTETTTGDDGGFKLEPLHPEAVYTVVAKQDDTGRLLVARHVSPGALQIVLALGGEMEQRASLALVVSELASGRRVDRFQVAYARRLEVGGWTQRWMKSYDGTSGIAELERQPSGVAYDLLVWAEGLGCAYLPNVAVTAEGNTAKAVLPALARLDVEATDGGAPAAWAIVETVRRQSAAESEVHWHLQRRIRADEDGRAALAKLEPGHYGVRVSHGGRSVVHEIDVAPGAAEALTVALP